MRPLTVYVGQGAQQDWVRGYRREQPHQGAARDTEVAYVAGVCQVGIGRVRDFNREMISFLLRLRLSMGT